jgi:hypothetical protein
MRPLFTTVLTLAVTRDLIVLADLREQLRVNPNDTSNNAWWSKVISRTSRQAERYCDRIFPQQGYRDTFRGNFSADIGEPLILSQAPVDPATINVLVDGTALDPVNDIALEPLAGLVYRVTDPQRWSSETSLTVAYTGGFAVIPDDVQQAVLDLCTMDNSGRGRDPMLRASETPGLGRQEYWVGGLPGGATIPQDIAGLLGPYRRGLVA